MVWVKGAAAVGVLLVGGGAWWVTNELMPPIHQTQTDIHSHSTKLLKLEGAINVLTNQQSDQTQRLIHDLLAAAKGAKPEIAAKATQAAASLMETLKADKRPAAPQFFEDATQGIGTLLKSGKAEVRTVAFGSNDNWPNTDLHFSHPCRADSIARVQTFDPFLARVVIRVRPIDLFAG